MDASQFHFIVIDDSFFDCRIAEKVIQNVGNPASVKIFQNADEAILYIKNKDTGSVADNRKTILFVDIQMPIMDGFGFVNEFEALSEETKSQYAFFFVTSSINENDIRRSINFPSVRKFLNKPLTSTVVRELLAEL